MGGEAGLPQCEAAHVTPTDGGCTNRLTLDLEGFGSSLFVGWWGAA